jgi:hypothetical protein
MDGNPFVNTPLEEFWDQGFVVGFMAPNIDHPAPTPLAPDRAQAYAEGVLFGVTTAHGVSVPPVPPPAKPGTWKDVLELCEIGGDVGHTVYHIVTNIPKAAGIGLAGGITLFVSVAILGPDRSEPFFEEAADQAIRRVRNQLAEVGAIPDSVDLFMSACDRPDHHLGEQDEIFRQGFWHGRVFLSFDQAAAEGFAHEHPDDVKVLRSQTAAPGLIEIIELPAAC